MFTINLEDGREAPSKARKKGAKRLEFLVIYIPLFIDGKTLLSSLWQVSIPTLKGTFSETVSKALFFSYN